MSRLLRIVLALVGLALVVLSLNTAIGGMATLGWQFPPDAVAARDLEMFARHDSNARFFAGSFAGLGLVIGAGAIWPDRLRLPVMLAFLSICLGGLARLTDPGYSPLSDMALFPSWVFEVILAPTTALWVSRSRP